MFWQCWCQTECSYTYVCKSVSQRTLVRTSLCDHLSQSYLYIYLCSWQGDSRPAGHPPPPPQKKRGGLMVYELIQPGSLTNGTGDPQIHALGTEGKTARGCTARMMSRKRDSLVQQLPAMTPLIGSSLLSSSFCV